MDITIRLVLVDANCTCEAECHESTGSQQLHVKKWLTFLQLVL